MANCVAVVLARESCSIVVAVFLLTVFFATNVRGQGTFTVNITGTELFGGTRLPINGGGMLQFERGNLHCVVLKKCFIHDFNLLRQNPVPVKLGQVSIGN